jgi:hypothetical protein
MATRFIKEYVKANARTYGSGLRERINAFEIAVRHKCSLSTVQHHQKHGWPQLNGGTLTAMSLPLPDGSGRKEKTYLATDVAALFTLPRDGMFGTEEEIRYTLEDFADSLKVCIETVILWGPSPEAESTDGPTNEDEAEPSLCPYLVNPETRQYGYPLEYEWEFDRTVRHWRRTYSEEDRKEIAENMAAYETACKAGEHTFPDGVERVDADTFKKMCGANGKPAGPRSFWLWNHKACPHLGRRTLTPPVQWGRRKWYLKSEAEAIAESRKALAKGRYVVDGQEYVSAARSQAESRASRAGEEGAAELVSAPTLAKWEAEGLITSVVQPNKRGGHGKQRENRPEGTERKVFPVEQIKSVMKQKAEPFHGVYKRPDGRTAYNLATAAAKFKFPYRTLVNYVNGDKDHATCPYHPERYLPSEPMVNPRTGQTEITVLRADMKMIRLARKAELRAGRLQGDFKRTEEILDWFNGPRPADQRLTEGEKQTARYFLSSLAEQGLLEREEVTVPRTRRDGRKWKPRVVRYMVGRDFQILHRLLGGKHILGAAQAWRAALEGTPAAPDDMPPVAPGDTNDHEAPRPQRHAGGRPPSEWTAKLYARCYHLYVVEDKGAATVKSILNEEYRRKVIRDESMVTTYANRHADKFGWLFRSKVRTPRFSGLSGGHGRDRLAGRSLG